MATIKDVAEAAGVSIASVSNALTGAKRVSPGTYQQIMAAVQALDYHPNQIASSLKINKTMIIGFVYTSVDSGFFPYVFSGVQKACEPYGYTLAFYSTNYSTAQEKKYMRMLMNSQVDGIIIDSVVDDADVEYFSKLSKLSARNKPIPVVSIERDLTSFGINSISINNMKGGRMATDHLFDIGCKSVVHIAGPRAVPWSAERVQGYMASLKEHDQPFTTSYINYSDYTSVGGYMRMQNILMNALPFDGLFAGNDAMAIGAVKALQEAGMKVPDDVRLVGFDNIYVTSLLSPSFTTINVPKQRLGEEAANILMQVLQDPDKKREPCFFELPINLIERRSTNPNAVANWELHL